MIEIALLDAVKEYAAIRRGEHPDWKGDRILNGEEYAFQIGYDYPLDALIFIQSLKDSEREYSMLTGLPPKALRIMADYINRGYKKGLRQARAEERG